MYQRTSRRCCALMLTVSICLRICMFLGLDARAAALLAEAAQDTGFARFLFYLETGRTASDEKAQAQAREASQPETVVLRYLTPQPKKLAASIAEAEPEPAAPAPEPEPILPEALASAEQISVAGACTYTFDKQALLERPSALDFSAEGPAVLIVHTHSSEAYTQEAGWEYDPLVPYRTLDAERSVIAVGDALAQTLQDAGIAVVHDRSVNDYPAYNESYWTCLDKIEAWQEAYPQIQIILDIHRDAVTDGAGNALALSCTEEGRSAAQLMLVVGTDQGGLHHPNWQENLANALKLQSVLEGSCPGLCRSLDLRTERFNQHAAPGALLVEVGTNGNTLRQALYSAQLLGDGLARMIHALQANDGVLTQGIMAPKK